MLFGLSLHGLRDKTYSLYIHVHVLANRVACLKLSNVLWFSYIIMVRCATPCNLSDPAPALVDHELEDKGRKHMAQILKPHT